LRHKSKARKDNNERLEFLGDSVMSTAVAKYLMERYPDSDEGFLTKMRTKLVKGSTQSMLARRIGLGEVVELSQEAEETGKREDDSVLEDALEALCGALFLDRGFDEVSSWITSLYEKYFDFSDAVREEVTEKERLLKVSRHRGDVIEFEHVRMIADRHKVIVRKTVRGSPAGCVVGVGEGGSKKEATDDACRMGLRHYSA
jgi:ribonuclease-3